MNNTEITIIATFAGILGWPLLSGAFFLLRYFYWRATSKYPWQGTWYSHHFTKRQGEVTFICKKWELSKGFRKKYVGLVRKSEDDSLIYKCYASEERADVIFNVQSAIKGETFVFRTRRIFWDDSQALLGFYLGDNFDNNITTGAMIFSREELHREKIKAVINAQYVTEQNELISHLKF